MKRIYYLLFLLFIVQAASSQNNAVLSSINTYNYHIVGSYIDIEVSILNAGTNNITSMDITWSDGSNSYTDNLSGLNIAPQSTFDVPHGTLFQVVAGTTPINVSISNVNGGIDDTPSDNTADTNISGVTFIPKKYVILEEAAGAWCGFCPRGYVEMEYMSNTYPESFLGISVHGGDPMETSYNNSFSNLISGYPSGVVNREEPWIGIDTDNFESAYNDAIIKIAPAELSFTSVNYDNTSRALTAELSAEFVAELSGDYRLNLILIEDDVTGTSSGYDQANYYSGGSIALVGAGHDWQAAANPVPAADMAYNYVARDILGGFTGQAGSLPANISAGEVHSYTFSTVLPTDWDENNIRLIGALQDNTNSTIGQFLNGTPGQIFCNMDGIQNGDETGIDCGGVNCPPCTLAPSISTNPTDTTISEGETATFSIVAENATNYQWYESTDGGINFNPIINNGTYNGANTPTLSIITDLTMDGNLYQCLVAGNDPPPAISTSATLYVTPLIPPSITSQPTDTTTLEGISATFSIIAENATNYQWYESTDGGSSYNPINDNGVYAGSTTDTLTITPTLAMNGNLYQCLVAGDIPPIVISTSATLYVDPLVPPSITSQPSDATTFEGTSTTFTIIAENAVSYQWYESINGGSSYNPINDNGIYAGSTTAILTVTPVLSMNGYRYQCIVTGNVFPPAISNSAVLSVDAVVCDIPTNTNVEMTTATNASFSWDAMPNATFYQVKYRLKGTTAWLTSGTAGTQRNVSNLTAKKYYQFKVRAQCGSEWSDFSDIQLFYTSACDVPTGVSVSFSDDTRMRVRWDNNPDEIKGKIRYRAVGITNWVTQNSQNGNNFLWVNDLPTGATIQYKVRSNCDGNDWSAYSPLYTHVLSNSGARLSHEETNNVIELYPNPVRDVLNIKFETKNEEEVSVTISNHLGRIIHVFNNIYNEGIQTESINIGSFPNGYYLITIHSANKIASEKFLKAK